MNFILSLEGDSFSKHIPLCYMDSVPLCLHDTVIKTFCAVQHLFHKIPQLLILLPKWIFDCLRRGTQGTKEVKSQCTMVQNFEWERLHKKLEGELSKLKQKRRQKSTKKTKADQIIEEVRKGHLSKAARKLQSRSGFRDLSVPENCETAKNVYLRFE